MELLACIREQKVYLCNLIPLPMGKKCAIEAGKNIKVKRLESENLGFKALFHPIRNFKKSI